MSAGYQKISFQRAHELMLEEKSYCFFDVREDEEYITGHAEGAELFPLDSIDEENAAERIPETDTPVFLYCRSGARSFLAAQKLLGFGYTRVYDLGGLNGWPYGLW
ncbi:MAG: rhodanese-like domain-containing protein [Oscillospiraceae bacterium]|nr:rhodanese-like domain-containing protein [Oscillospiraceae bacterium]